MSAGLIIVIAVAGALAIAAWPITVALTRRGNARRAEPARGRPARGQAETNPEHRRGNVQGGSHVGGGRSLGPRRDAEISPDDKPEDTAVPVHESNGPLDR